MRPQLLLDNLDCGVQLLLQIQESFAFQIGAFTVQALPVQLQLFGKLVGRGCNASVTRGIESRKV